MPVYSLFSTQAKGTHGRDRRTCRRGCCGVSDWHERYGLLPGRLSGRLRPGSLFTLTLLLHSRYCTTPMACTVGL
jgi:hypothetical protein